MLDAVNFMKITLSNGVADLGDTFLRVRSRVHGSIRVLSKDPGP
jgi:hypothetical protein